MRYEEMKRRLFLLLAALLLLCGCAPEHAETEQAQLPPELLGVWVSASAGEREMVETITFGADGSLSVHLDYEGSDYSTIYGTYAVEGERVLCDITEGTTPFQVAYTYAVEGRELWLTGDSSTAHYLRSA